MIKVVKFSRQLEKQLKKVPFHVAVKFQYWVDQVEENDLEEIRKIPGFHDEPLKGNLEGLRSIRLSLSYRAYYRIVKEAIEIAYVERIDKHEY